MRRHHIHHHCRRPAPGGPGIEPRWTRAAKDAVGTSHSSALHVWFTVDRGVLTEVYWPALDRPRVRNGQFLVGHGATSPPRPFSIRWSGDEWATAHEAGGMGTAVKIWYHDVAPGNVPGNDVRFTFRWEDTDEWDTTDNRVEIRQ